MMYRLLKSLVVVALVVVAALGGLAIGAPLIVRGSEESNQEVLKFEVAEDHTRFVFDEAPVFEDGMPAYGSTFITQGYIYPEGTLNGSNGVLKDGSPAFPDKVLGEWSCRGWLVGDGAHTEAGAWVITTQVYQFGEGYGNLTIVSEGYETPEVGTSIKRAVTGGTGEYSSVRGEVTQTLLGFTDYFGVNVHYTIDLTK